MASFLKPAIARTRRRPMLPPPQRLPFSPTLALVPASHAAWFEAHWTIQAPPEPSEPPSAASVLAGAGSGIRWYAQDHVVFGYVSSRRDGCYRVTSDDAVPVLVAPWEVVAAEQADSGEFHGAS